MKQILSHVSKLGRVGLAASLITVLSSLTYAEAPKISGFIDTTYTYDTNRPLSRITGGRSFDRRSGDFLLNALQVNIAGDAGEGIGYYGELAFGTDPSIYKSAGTGADGAIGAAPVAPSMIAYNFEVQEAFITYKCPTTSIMAKAGKFVTFQGIEVIESKDNPTMTRGAIFSLAEPYSHVGALLGYQLTTMFDVWLGVVNGWDLHIDNNSGKTLVGKVGIALSDKIGGSVSFTRGAEQLNNTLNQRTSVDTTWFVKPTSDISVGVQLNVGEEDKAALAGPNVGGAAHWYGFGIQPKFIFTDKISLGSRYEYFSDKDGARNGSGLGIVANSITLTPTFDLTESLVFRTEYRFDSTSVGVYEKSDGTVTKDNVSTLGAEFIYKF